MSSYFPDRTYRLPQTEPTLEFDSLQSIPESSAGQFDDGIPARTPDRKYSGARQIGMYTAHHQLMGNRARLRQAVVDTGRPLSEFLCVIPALELWLAGETPSGAEQRFQCAALCQVLRIKLYDAFPDLMVDYHA